MKSVEGVPEPLAGGAVLDVVPVGKGDFSDWVELMEAVEVSCPVWPAAPKDSQRGSAGN